jgi:catecholate siderophore receptor
MSKIRSRKHPTGRYLAALSVIGAAALSAGVAQADAPEDHTAHVTVRGHHDTYKAEVSSPKKTEDLVNTPQTLSVISKELLEDQNATTLTDALRNTPGITMQLGENGNTSTGDTFQLRGFSATSSIYLDGIRDLGAVSRDVFNIEQVEVAKGPAGSDAGRGASGGYINLVSKLPFPRARSSATISAYSQGGTRAAADVNLPTGRTSGFRLNVMAQDVDVPGRNEVNNSGWGIAPAYGVGLGTDTRFFIFAQVVHQDNVPDGGFPVVGLEGYKSNATLPTTGAAITQAQLDLNNAALTAAPRPDRHNFYGSVNDYEKVDASMLTSKVEHSFANGWNLTNTTRYGQNKMDRVLTGINATNATAAAFKPADKTTWTVARSRQGVDQENKILANATNFVGSFNTGDWQHDLSTGLELTYEEQLSYTLSTTPPTGSAPTIPAASLYNPDPNIVLPALYKTGATSDGESTTVSGYVFDTAKHGPWLLSAGLRVDNYTIKTNNTPATGGAAIAPIHDSGTIASWNLGVVYKPRENGSLYVALINAMTPPGSSNFQLSSTASSLANAAFDPVETENLEIGTKWDFFEKHLSLTGAYYTTKAKNELSLEDPTNLGTFIQLGEREVNGFEFGLVGQVNPKWMVSAGVQTMHTEITQGTTGNNTNGAATRWSPDLTATFWTTYKVTPKFTIGGGASYTSEQKLVVNPATVIGTQNGLPQIPANTVFNGMASYDINPRVALQLNVYNLTNEDYISSLNNGGSRVVLGKPQSATLSLRVRF